MDLEQVRQLKQELIRLNIISNYSDQQADNEDDAYTCGMVALAVPREVTSEWGLHVENAHITLLYFPHVNLPMVNRIAILLQEVLERVKPFEVTTRDRDWFGTEKDTCVVLVRPSLELTELRAACYQAVAQEYPGIIDTKYPVYKPHITIGSKGDEFTTDYLDTDGVYKFDTVMVQLMDRETYLIKLRE